MRVADALFFGRQLHVVTIKQAKVGVVIAGNDERSVLERHFDDIPEPFRTEDAPFPLRHANAFVARTVVSVLLLKASADLRAHTEHGGNILSKVIEGTGPLILSGNALTMN